VNVSAAAPAETFTREVVDKLLERAKNGDRSCLPRLRAVLRAEAEGGRDSCCLEVYGSPPEWLKRSMVDGFAGKNLAFSEASRVKLEGLRRELEGPNPTALERVLAERAALCWFNVYRLETLYEHNKGLSIRQAEFQVRQIDAAHRRFLSAVKTLAQVRKLAVPALQVNIGANQVNMA
jgi:hypothetical protein